MTRVLNLLVTLRPVSLIPVGIYRSIDANSHSPVTADVSSKRWILSNFGISESTSLRFAQWCQNEALPCAEKQMRFSKTFLTGSTGFQLISNGKPCEMSMKSSRATFLLMNTRETVGKWGKTSEYRFSILSYRRECSEQQYYVVVMKKNEKTIRKL